MHPALLCRLDQRDDELCTLEHARDNVLMTTIPVERDRENETAYGDFDQMLEQLDHQKPFPGTAANLSRELLSSELLTEVSVAKIINNVKCFKNAILTQIKKTSASLADVS